MDMTWVSQADPDAPPFRNDTSASLHYWLSTLPTAPRPGRDAGLRSAVDLAARLEDGTRGLVDRAFTR